MTKGSDRMHGQQSVAGAGLSSLVVRPSSAHSSISLTESLRIALETLMANKLRTLLTALGVIIGVAAVVALLALGRGSQEQIAESITKNGANLLTVRAGSVGAGGFTSSGGATRSLTIEDAKVLADPANEAGAAVVLPQAITFGTVTSGVKDTSAMIPGATAAYLKIHNDTLDQGQFID